ncbi:Uma2 family endonuclease [Frigoriglobus tundricola]|uniref:Putative restriction endonuclease domain-containing protein n=1 Tax=Frigoriglobus tundricola TaxID=2774151 RepID=A0A6M5YRK6_9BACT|nr:Uma2 family endonuclease [Frigoriglobus tundricola]QJW96717.1 hypothetical protein FTUN_4276 [Frigoriglobus tundricola]
MSAAARVTKKPNRTVPLPPAVPPFAVHRFTVAEYHKMIETGVLTTSHRVELIHGWLVTKMTLNPPHNYTVTALMELLQSLKIANSTIRVQQPVTTTDSEPEPDVVIAAGTNPTYKTRNPKPSDVLLVMEVSESSLHEDRTTKLGLYAGAKIGVYWIVNLVDRCVEVYTQPRGGKNPTYKQRTDYGPDDVVPVVIAGQSVGTIAVKELLP